ncbi:PIN domain-containing protein [Pseudofrankia asymbiotica]|uniref:PIN domain-containing protein n=1 Tax=Pseudofrankia asymbiotica TaxID=1834516 RepID=UPI0018E9DA12
MLYPAYLCDTLLRLTEADVYRPLWSDDILIELRRNVLAAGLPADRIDKRLGNMRRYFPDATVTGYEHLVDGMTNDAKDRHVLAAAVRANAEAIVTFNLRDFPAPSLKPYDLTAIHPDEFLLDQLDLYPELTIEVLERQAASYRREPTTVAGLLPLLARTGLPRFTPRYGATSANRDRRRVPGFFQGGDDDRDKLREPVTSPPAGEQSTSRSGGCRRRGLDGVATRESQPIRAPLAANATRAIRS